MTESLPPSLDRFGRELEAAIRRDLGRGPDQSHARGRQRRVGVVAVLAAAVAVVIGLSGGKPQPAYALVRHVDGTVTVTLHRLSGAVMPLNRRFHALGIDETVLPVGTGCRTSAIFVTVTPGGSSDQLTFRSGRRFLLAGWHGIIAARALRSGRVALILGAVRGHVPSCIALAPTRRVLGFRHAGRSVSAANAAGGPRSAGAEALIVKQSRLLAIAIAGSDHAGRRGPGAR
jgi:hypothetical protein